jgi:acyl-coenzyme A synthetase/AMP-(fatty) acid ligase
MDVSELEQFCRQRLASFKIPKRWVFSSEGLPRTNSGKVVKSALRGTMALS